MFDKICYLFILFIVYSVVGYIIEITNCSLREKKLILNRGFFLGPYLPIYGVSCLVMYGILTRYDNDIFTVFVMSAFICTVIEYVTSYILEKVFKARWWDYSNKKFNLEGRVCLINSFYFVDRQNKNAKQISELASRMLDKFVELYNELLKARENLDNSIKKLDGKDNIMRQIERMQECGVKMNKTVNKLQEEQM